MKGVYLRLSCEFNSVYDSLSISLCSKQRMRSLAVFIGTANVTEVQHFKRTSPSPLFLPKEASPRRFLTAHSSSKRFDPCHFGSQTWPRHWPALGLDSLTSLISYQVAKRKSKMAAFVYDFWQLSTGIS